MLRIRWSPSFTASTAPEKEERIPFVKVETTFCPDVKNQVTAPSTEAFMLSSPPVKALRASRNFPEMPCRR